MSYIILFLKRGSPPKFAKCNGCKSNNLFINCKHCVIRACAINPKVEHCNECNQYP
ncbi:DUF3795 domain-containing protein [Desulfosporosinus lacus]|uniref:DUF3795 domain-containing protein n=1 Tax=Desulfosporosinus lacus TaxID=329936 RepID=UPI003D051DA3